MAGSDFCLPSPKRRRPHGRLFKSNDIIFGSQRPNIKDRVIAYDSDSSTDAYCDDSADDYEPEYEFEQACPSQLSHCRRKQTQVGLPTSQNQSQSWCCSQSRETPVSQLIQSQKQTVTLKQTPLTHQTQSQTVNLSRQRQTQSQKQTQVTGRGISDEHEKQNKKNRSMPQSEDESTNGISFN